ncbi:MAG TPA: PEGA domain-containing protein [Kofleriaceae bacterium]|nr:PEGA domain-containing protein [Kofleriaceae bacterium]
MSRAALVVLALAACGPRPAPNAIAPDDAVVYVRSNVGDAQVYVDGRFVGPINVLRGGIAVDPGKHRLELRRDDYFSRYVELDLGRAERKKLQLPMAPVLP